MNDQVVINWLALKFAFKTEEINEHSEAIAKCKLVPGDLIRLVYTIDFDGDGITSEHVPGVLALLPKAYDIEILENNVLSRPLTAVQLEHLKVIAQYLDEEL